MRKHKKPLEWRELILAQQNSELSVLAFCSSISYQPVHFIKIEPSYFLVRLSHLHLSAQK